MLVSPDACADLFAGCCEYGDDGIRLELARNKDPYRCFLRLTLMYPVECNRSPVLVSECMASWFVYRGLKPEESRILHCKKNLQPMPYRAYRGWLFAL